MRHPRRLATALALPAVLSIALATPAPAEAASSTSSEVDRGVTHGQNPLVPVGASWTQHWFSSPQEDSPTAVELHADVLRPTGLRPGERTPVIVSVGPYFSHAGQVGVETTKTGPSQRFADLIEGAKLMDRGYTVVLVDLRGYGGSTGCLDWNGPGEQADIKTSVEWAAAQDWSTGKVGTYGKSYDAQTGLWANDLRPKGLAAVVAQEPLWNGYNYYYSNGVARPNNVYTPEAYNSIAQIPATAGDSARYKRNAGYEQSHPECLSRNLTAGVDNTSPDDAYWRDRDNVGQAKGTRTPIFFTQGFTESNTKPEQMQQYLTNHTGPERGWMGPWEHVRGNETDPDTGRLAMGRAGWFDEVIRFYDRYLKDRSPTVTDPTFAIQGSNGVWRAQRHWPSAAVPSTVRLRAGRYLDNGAPAVARQVTDRGGQTDRQVRSELSTAAGELRTTAATATSYLSASRPIARTTRLTATPSVRLQTRGSGEVLVRLYDVDPATDRGVLINENVARLTGRQTSFDLKSLDWQLGKGHRLVVSIGTVDPDGYWTPQPSGTTVRVTGAFLSLDSQSPRRDVRTAGAKSIFLDAYKEDNAVSFGTVPKGSFTVPAPKR